MALPEYHSLSDSHLIYLFPVCQSSLISITTAVTSRRQEASLGKSDATRVRRRISRFRRSSPLVVRIRRLCDSGKANTVNPCGKFSSIQVDSFGASLAYFPTVFFSKEFASCLLGALKTARISEATTAFMSLRGT